MGEAMETTRPDQTESLCPVCLKTVAATRQPQGDDVFLIKECADHGRFSTIIWRGTPSMAEWRRPKQPAHPDLCYGIVERGCPYDCGLCNAHQQRPCSVLLEVTSRCNLHCAVCFADSGDGGDDDPSLAALTWRLERAMAAAGPCNLQLSGGEPTLRDDLPDIVEIARRVGYSFIQLNTNGLRLAADRGYADRLAAAGLSSVFLQFDGTDDQVYHRLRGRPLLERKLQAVANAGAAGLGVVLVPTLVGGVNTDSIGALLRQALALAPTVRGIHFQPFSQFGRFPDQDVDRRVTLPEVMRALDAQTNGLVKVSDFSPPGGEHAHCSFHASYICSADGGLRPLGGAAAQSSCCSPAAGGGIAKTVETVSRRWTLPVKPSAAAECCAPVTSAAITRNDGPLTLEVFLREAVSRSFTISAMAFQDAENLDLERLRGCCIAVLSPTGGLIPFCAYNLTGRDGTSLYRRRGGAES